MNIPWKGNISCSDCSVRLNVFSKKKPCFFCKNFFCQTCIFPRQDKKFCCRKCQILTARPLDRNKLLNLKSRDLVNYLSSRHIPTNGCVEKEDLVNVLIKAVNNSCFHASSTCYDSGSSTSSYPNSHRNFHFKPLRTPGHGTENKQSVCNFEDGIRIRGNTTVDSNVILNQSSCIQSDSFVHFNQSSNSLDIQHSGNLENVNENNEEVETLNDLASGANISSVSCTKNNESYSNKPLMLCDIKSKSDLDSLSVKQLKELLMRNRTDFKGCIEREELVQKANTLWNDYTTSRKDLENLTTDDLCKICMDAPIECVLLECGHMATCTSCGKQLFECPICRQFVVRCVRTFKA